MKRLTSNRDTHEMDVVELAHNSCYRGKDGWARYRDYDMDIDARELTIKLLKGHAGCGDVSLDDDFGGWMADGLYDGMDSLEGLIALFYRNLWAMADLRERLKYYEDLEEQGKLLELPCAVGDTVYEVQDLRKRIQQYTIIAIHTSNCGNLYGWELKDGKGIYSNVNGFSEYALGKSVFLTKEEAEAALKELGGGKNEQI